MLIVLPTIQSSSTVGKVADAEGVGAGAGVVVVGELSQPAVTKATIATVPINSLMPFTVDPLYYRNE